MRDSDETHAPLPSEVAEFVERIVRRSSWRRSVQNEVRRELLAHFDDALERVPAEKRTEAVQRMLRDFGTPEMLGALINRGKQRCRPLWEKAAWNLAKALTVAAVILPALAWVAGQRAERAYEETVTDLREQGALRDVTQLRSTRPPGTIFYEGPDEGCSTAILLSFPHDDALSKAIIRAFRTLRFMDAQKERANRDLISAHEEQLDRLRRAAPLPPTSMEQVIRVTGFQNPPGERREPAPAINVVRLMLLNAFLLHRAGRDDEALAECDRAASLANHLRDVPGLLSQIVARVIEIDMARVLAPVTLAGTISKEAAHTFDRDRDQCRNREALAQAIELEGGNIRWIIHDSGYVISGIAGIAGTTNWSWSARLLARFYLTPFARTISGPDEINYYTHYREMAACARRPFFEIREQVELLLQVEKWIKAPSITGVLTPPRGRDYFADAAMAETRMSEAHVALALNLYKTDMGNYPATLAALVPEYLAEIPVDPYTGSALSYALRDGRYFLYSVGFNGQDETLSAEWAGKDPEEVRIGDDIIWGITTASNE